MALLGEFFQLQVIFSAFLLTFYRIFFYHGDTYRSIKESPLNKFKTKCSFVCVEICHESYLALVSQYGISGVLRACCFLFGNHSIVHLFLEEQGYICL